MNLLSYPLGVMLLLSALAVHASDDMRIYSGRFDNGWGDSWSWMPRYAKNSPVYTSNSVYVPSNSMALVPSGQWQAWWLKSGANLDTTIYTNVTFWLNGGPTGGQSIVVSGETNGSGLPGIWVAAPTSTWKQITISLASLGINSVSNLTGLQIGNGTSIQPFFIDDLRLVAAPAPAIVHVGINANQIVPTVSGNVFGINQVAWDGGVETPASVTLLNDMGNPCLRWPGGSWGDGYHWTNEAWSYGNTSARTWGSFSTNFIWLATNTHAQAFIIVNYGSSDANEAAYGVRMFNVTNHCKFKYWEVGNEVGGSWEVDNNTNPPWQPHDPWTYAMRFTNYYAHMKAADPTIKIGAVADTTEDGTSNYTNHPVVNPRTGLTHNGWTPVMLTYMRSNNCIPDFLIEHNYGPTAGDTQDLFYSKKWASDAASLRQMLSDYLGSAGTNVTLEATENGTGGDKQCVNLTGGLFYADTIGQILQTEFNTNATVYSYGIPQDTAAETGLGSPDLAQTNLTGVQNGFSVSFAPFSASVMVLSAAPPPLLAALPAPPGNFGFQLRGQSGGSYVLQCSADLASWTNRFTITLSGSSANFTNAISGPMRFWRGLWQP